MKANELMIGDWVHYAKGVERGYNPYVQVVEIYGGYITTKNGLTVRLDRNVFEGGKDDLFEPIPITPEIMEKNGFIKVPREYEFPECQCWTDNENSIDCFEINSECDGPYILGMAEMGDKEWINFPCNHVHELQHALRLCGIEKEIVL